MRAGVLGLSVCLVGLGAVLGPLARAATSGDCTRLAGLKLKHTRIVAAETLEGPTFTPPPAPVAAQGAQPPAPLGELPTFCRVRAIIDPAIQFELWLPLSNWNGKFEGTGNGGYAGAIVYTALAAGLRRHYAVSSTDMGHVSTAPDPGSWALGHAGLIVDQGYRAQHETALRSKEIVVAFYGNKPRLSYFVGCSSGGWQGMTEAQRYPNEYNGIVAGAPAFEVIHLHAGTLWTHLATQEIAADKFRLITDAVLARCDAADGVKDGLLQDPRTCKFSPAELACREGQDSSRCLTAGEVAALQRIYDGLRDSSGAVIYPGWPRGVEYALPMMRQPFVAALASSTFKDMVFGDPSWDYHQIDYERDVRRADAKLGAVLNNFSTDLTAFRRAGGKLILWHGWDDPLISPLHTLEYYRAVATFFAGGGQVGAGDDAKAVEAISGFARLFLAPGVNHCGGGPGPDTFDALGALEAWVEHGVAPEQMIASHQTQGTVDRTRPVCAYPRTAVYSGSGSTDEAKSFSCRIP
jgi:feruloyl esterase